MFRKPGTNVFIFPPFHFTSPERIEFGNQINIAQNCLVGGAGGVEIGNFVMVGPNSCILSSNHGFNRPDIPMLRQKPTLAPIKIKDDVWIGANVVILPGVTVNQGAIIGAGSIVTKDVEPYSIVAGNPAKLLKKRFPSTKIKKLLLSTSPLFNYYRRDYLETSRPTFYSADEKS